MQKKLRRIYSSTHFYLTLLSLDSLFNKISSELAIVRVFSTVILVLVIISYFKFKN